MFFGSAIKTQTWLKTLRSCSCKVLLNSVQRFQRDDENISTNQRLCSNLVFPMDYENTNLVEDVEILLPDKVR